MFSLSTVTIGSSNVKALAAFYGKVLDQKTEYENDGWHVWKVGVTYLVIGEHSEVKGKSKEPPRIMFNLDTKDVKGEFKRIKELGAEVIAEPYEQGGGWIATFADPDGNYFQLVTSWEE